nr:HAD family hydrolase [uncultured Acetobacter sp.]
MPYKVLICDFDGTLADTRTSVAICVRRTLQELCGASASLCDGEIEAVLARGATLGATFEQFIGQLSGQFITVDACVARYRHHYAAEGLRWTTLFPGVRACLAQARTAGVRLAVVSNKGEAALHAALKHFDLSEYFELVLGEQPDLPPKPEPDLFEQRILPFFAPANRAEMLFVGDTSADLLFALNCGMEACWVTYGHGKPDACRALKPRYEIQNFQALEACFPVLSQRNTSPPSIITD